VRRGDFPPLGLQKENRRFPPVFVAIFVEFGNRYFISRRVGMARQALSFAPSPENRPVASLRRFAAKTAFPASRPRNTRFGRRRWGDLPAPAPY
jgi:hypothetical protein